MICICKHDQKEHYFFEQTIKSSIDKLIKEGYLLFNSDYDLARITAGSGIPKNLTMKKIIEKFEKLRKKESRCRKWNDCFCQCFKADNIKYLENMYEQSK